MEFKGTKGKWSIIETFDPNYDQPVFTIDSYEVGQQDIITVWSGQDIGEEIDTEIKANALLISKAPEMLEMLKMLVRLSIAQGANDEWIEIKEAKRLINEATNV